MDSLIGYTNVLLSPPPALEDSLIGYDNISFAEGNPFRNSHIGYAQLDIGRNEFHSVTDVWMGVGGVPRQVLSTYLGVQGLIRNVSSVILGRTTLMEKMLDREFYWAHRGGSRSWPEMTMYAYEQSALRNYDALEFSLGRSSDGVWFGCHDETLSRITGGALTGRPSDYTWAQIRETEVVGSIAADNPTQPGRPHLTLDDFLDRFYGERVLIFDVKHQSSHDHELFNKLNSLPGIPQSNIMGKFFGISAFNIPWQRDGYLAWGYFYEDNASDYNTYLGRWDLLGLEYTASRAHWNRLLEENKPVVSHILPNEAAVAMSRDKGASGFQVSGVDVVHREE